MDEIAGGYRPAGDLQPPPFPLLGGLGWLFGEQDGVWLLCSDVRV
jgi:hypothetical protein